MGKKLIIKGADFSEHKVLPYSKDMNYIFTTVVDQQVILNLGNSINLNTTKITVQFYDTESEDSNNKKFMETNGSSVCYLRSVGETYSVNYNNNGVTNIPKSRGLHTVVMTSEKVIFDGTDYTTGTLNGKTPSTMYIFTSNTGGGAAVGTKKIKLIKVETTGGSVLNELVPVLDLNNKPCFFDKVIGNLLYAEGDDDLGAE